jgi:hypothetical protein
VLVLLLGLAACANRTPAAAPAKSNSPAPAAAATKESTPDACCEGDDADESTPAAAPAASAHEFKPVTPSASYPLNECLITGEELGPVEERVAFSYDGTEVQFCCPGCAKKFVKNPAPYLAKLAAAKSK